MAVTHVFMRDWNGWLVFNVCLGGSSHWINWQWQIAMWLTGTHIHTSWASWCNDAGARSCQLWLRLLQHCGDQGVCINNWGIHCRRAYGESKECKRQSVSHTFGCNGCEASPWAVCLENLTAMILQYAKISGTRTFGALYSSWHASSSLLD